MGEKNKIVVLYKEEMDKYEPNTIIKEVKESLDKNKTLTNQDKEILLNAIKEIEQGKVYFYTEETIDSKEKEQVLIQDVQDKKIELIIAEDTKTFSNIANDPNVSRLIAEICSVYTLDGEINTISPEKKLEMRLFNSLRFDYKKESDKRSAIGEKLKKIKNK